VSERGWIEKAIALVDHRDIDNHAVKASAAAELVTLRAELARTEKTTNGKQGSRPEGGDVTGRQRITVRIPIRDVEFVASGPEFVCPSCGRQYLAGDLGSNTTRVSCPCGQALIVEKRVGIPVKKEET